MSTVFVRIKKDLVDSARAASKAEFRTVQGQLEFWARVGRAALDNPDLPASFIAESLMSMAEPRDDATDFKDTYNRGDFMTQDVIITVDNGIQTITLNRPEARNAMTLAMAKQIAQALDELDNNDTINVSILTGAGGSFCAGMDLKRFLEGERPSIPGRGFGGLTARPPKKPLIAAVEGYALAGGFELVLACDLIVAASTAKFGIPEVKRGLAAVGGGLLRLPQQIPYRVAMELALTGEMFSAEKALELGLINRVSEPGSTLEQAHQLAAKITENGPLGVQASKQVIQESRDWPLAEMWDKQRALTEHVFESEDAREGSKAFAEKRKPNWKGR